MKKKKEKKCNESKTREVETLELDERSQRINDILLEGAIFHIESKALKFILEPWTDTPDSRRITTSLQIGKAFLGFLFYFGAKRILRDLSFPPLLRFFEIAERNLTFSRGLINATRNWTTRLSSKWIKFLLVILLLFIHLLVLEFKREGWRNWSIESNCFGRILLLN